MKKVPGVYVIADLTTGKSYVGSSNDLPVRLYQHSRNLAKKDHKNPQLQRAYNKGNTLAYLPIPVKEGVNVLEVEQAIIDEFYAEGTLYNHLPNVLPNTAGRTLSQEERNKVSAGMRRYFENPAARAAQSERTKKYLSDETNRARMIERTKLAASNPEFLLMQRENANRQWADPEARRQKSEATKKQLGDPVAFAHWEKSREHLLKPVSVDGTIYKSRHEAAEILGITAATVTGRTKSAKRPTWFYVESKK